MTDPVHATSDPISSLYSARRVARRRLLGHLVRARDHERQRIASAIHNVPLRALSAVATRLERAGRRADPALRGELDQVHETLVDAITRLRGLTFDLALGVRREEGLVAEVRTMLLQLQEESGLEVGLRDRMVTEPPPVVAGTAYRILQEALANIEHHARATRVDVTVEAHDGVYVRVEDDGVGFDPRRARPSPGQMGTAMMRQRAEAAGGWLHIHSAHGKGTVVEFLIPWLEERGSP